jgi:hypothetical protein
LNAAPDYIRNIPAVGFATKELGLSCSSYWSTVPSARYLLKSKIESYVEHVQNLIVFTLFYFFHLFPQGRVAYFPIFCVSVWKKTSASQLKLFNTLCTFAGCIAKMNNENTAQFRKKSCLYRIFTPQNLLIGSLQMH